MLQLKLPLLYDTRLELLRRITAMPNIMNRTSQRSSWHTVTKSLLLTLTSLLVYGVTGVQATSLTCGQCHETIPVDGSNRFSTIGRFQGSHNKHAGTSGQNHPCTDCHANNTTNTHSSGNIEMANPIHATANASYSKGTSFAINNATTLAGGYCSNTYCHSDGTGGTLNSGDNRTIPWNTSAVWGGSTTCNSCHGVGGASDGRPYYTSGSPKMNDHQAATHLSKTCDTCHDAVTYSGGNYTPITSIHNRGTYSIKSALGYTYNVGGGTCTSAACHGTAQWGVTVFDCVSCHKIVNNITVGPMATNGNQRRAVSLEFINTWSHARSIFVSTGITSISVIPKELCVTCHMEGNPANGSPMSSYHGNGYVDLRNPDTGEPIRMVRWISSQGNGNGWYTSDNSDAYMNTMAVFRRNLASSTLEPEVVATQYNLCLNCHDSNGAMHSFARVGGGTTSPFRPFNVAVSGLSTLGHNNVTALNGMAGSIGNMVNVKTSFMTTNAAYHPILGRGNNPQISGNMLLPPWNGVTKTVTTTARWGNLISCWDCHGATSYVWTSGAGGVAGGSTMMTFSVTAHGGPATLRGGSGQALWLGTIASQSLCLNCHRTIYSLGNNAHATTGFGTSAFTAGGSSMSSSFSNCGYCHSYYGLPGSARWTSAAGQGYLDRPLRAESVHGVNDRTPNTAGSVWNSSKSRPYAFIRNGMVDWRPASGGEFTAGSSTCSGSGGLCSSAIGNGSPYTPGGLY